MPRSRSSLQSPQSKTKNVFDLSRLRTALRPFRLHWFPRLRSTNDHAAEMRRRGELFAPAVVLTGHQTAGRGRGSNLWWSGAGCLTATFVLPVDDQAEPHQLPLVAGLAVRNAAAESSGNDAIQLKWPNDLLFDLRKLGGILCERVRGADLVGLGLNVNVDPAIAPPALRGRVTSLSAVAHGPLDMTEALTTVARHLHRAVSRRAQEPFSAVLREYDSHHALVGRRVTVAVTGAEAPLSGLCEGLDPTGRLVLRSRAKLHRVISGQVMLA